MHVSCGKKVLQFLLQEFVIKGCRSTEVDGANSSRWDFYTDIAGIRMQTVLVMFPITLKLLSS